MGASNDYVTESDEQEGAEGMEDEGLSDEQYQWLQEQLAHIGQLRIEEEEDTEEEWVDPSGGLLLNMYEACESGNLDRLTASVADLAATQHSLDTAGPDGDTALHVACLYGHMPCVEQLLAAGCTAAAINELDGTSALHDAAAGGYLAVVQLLLSKAPALLPVQDCDGDTALHNAARGGHLHVVQFLLEQGADESTLNSSGKTPAGEAEEPEVVAALVAAAAQRQRASGGGGGVAPAGGTSPGQQQQQQQPSDQPT